jgi:hypothetical protein
MRTKIEAQMDSVIGNIIRRRRSDSNMLPSYERAAEMTEADVDAMSGRRCHVGTV